MNLYFKENYEKLYDLCDQIFDYFQLTFYDFETAINANLSINMFKDKLETFSDKHFRSALKEFNFEIQNLKNKFPNELIQLENLSTEIRENFNQLINDRFFDLDIIIDLRNRFEESLSKIKLT
tara:strand:- start:379 stop:747 length:369 start_codon:yes stop_codon:yes gene_type:complete